MPNEEFDIFLEVESLGLCQTCIDEVKAEFGLAMLTVIEAGGKAGYSVNKTIQRLKIGKQVTKNGTFDTRMVEIGLQRHHAVHRQAMSDFIISVERKQGLKSCVVCGF